MSALTVEFDFTIGQRIEISALERRGTVRLVRFDGGQHEYFVSWWDEGKRQAEWLPADEIAPPRNRSIS